ncbi:MAG: hypothetical protein WC538_24640 [Thermoanaerobaculia bacterium]|jgi:hypothetical protein
MPHPGPPIELLTRRLAETPTEFLSPVLASDPGAVNLAAIVSDLIADLGGEPLPAESAKQFVARAKERDDELRLVLIASWLLHERWFIDQARFAPRALAFLSNGLGAVAKVVKPAKFVSDPDRREELARMCLAALDLLPAGESENVARDRLTTLSSVERQRVLAETRKAQEEQRRRKIEEEMARQKAAEAAPAWGRE